MEFIETPIFTKRIKPLMSDEDYHLLQLELTIRPESGDLIKHSGGIRKKRWTASGQGKSGGTRIVYYYIDTSNQIYMLFAYPKNEADNLSQDQIKQLRHLVQEYLK
ncbi:type II toxin-antitoxin system RelE/ParE family toxin [Balneolaceae bacterium ANBcel3]|nr:type II toxin-antitoxin system RelE/ParE family toxin [Balneolaceae bacterium ANBcel3]